MNAIAMKDSHANRNVMTHHMRHVFMPIIQTNEKVIYLMQQFVKSNYSNPIHLETKRAQLIVGTIQSHFATSWYISQYSH